METIESLWKYCTENNRAVPVNWHRVTEMLPAKPDASKAPAPFILAALSVPIKKKQARFKEHLIWARDTGVLDKVGTFLRALSEEEWDHFSEI